MDEKTELPVRFQEIPEFDQTQEAVVQLAPEVREDEVFYPVAVIKLPVEDSSSLDAPISGGKVVDTSDQALPISEDGTTSLAELAAAGYEVREIVEDDSVLSEETANTASISQG